jgi:hypothetical protein
MANRYDYNDKDFATRLMLRRIIADRNKRVQRIMTSEAGYTTESIKSGYTLLAHSFYGEYKNERVLECFVNRIRPVDGFSADAMKQYIYFMDDIIAEWPKWQQSATAKNQQHIFESMIKEYGSLSRARQEDANVLVEYHDSCVNVPKKITPEMIEKCRNGFTKDELDAFDSEFPEYWFLTRRTKPISKKVMKVISETAKATAKETAKEVIKAISEKQNSDKPELVRNLFNFEKFPEAAFTTAPKKEVRRISTGVYVEQNEEKIADQKELLKTLETNLKDAKFKRDSIQQEQDMLSPHNTSSEEFTLLGRQKQVAKTDVARIERAIRESNKKIALYQSRIEARHALDREDSLDAGLQPK